MTWARASRCPCFDPVSGSPKVGCPVCGARGWLWARPVDSIAGVSGMKVQREWAAFGQFESGDVVISIGSDQPLYAAGETDRVVFSQSSEPFDFVQTRGAPREWIASTVRFPVISFDRCFWLTPDGTAAVEGDLPTQALDGTCVWESGANAPPTGTQYTLQGRKRPEYFLQSAFAQDRAHFEGLALPRRVVLRRWSLFPA